MRKRAGAIIATCLLLFGLPSIAGAGSFEPGATGIGDGYFPFDGNGGYDVGHYDLSISYDPEDRRSSWCRADRRNCDEEPVDLQPRPGRTPRACRSSGRAAGPMEPGARRADDLAARRPATRT